MVIAWHFANKLAVVSFASWVLALLWSRVMLRMTVWILEDEAATSIATKGGRTTHIVLSAADPLNRDSEGIHHYGNDIIRASLVFPFFPFLTRVESTRFTMQRA